MKLDPDLIGYIAEYFASAVYFSCDNQLGISFISLLIIFTIFGHRIIIRDEEGVATLYNLRL